MNTTEHIVQGHDGWPLSVLELLPEVEPLATVLAGHAMMADKRSVVRPDKPCIARTLAELGFRVLAPDARGHGQSGPTAQEGGVWSYTDLVQDTGPLLQFARSRQPEVPIHVLGHSLFGHTSLAWLGRHPEANICSHIAIGVNIWCKQWEPNRSRWFQKAVTAKLMKLFTRLFGRFPARKLRIGPMDEASPYIQHVFDAVERGIWADDDGNPFHPPLAELTFPILHVLSEGDRVIADPESSTRFMSITGPMCTTMILGRRNDWNIPVHVQPDHMGLITKTESRVMWEAVGKWMLERV